MVCSMYCFSLIRYCWPSHCLKINGYHVYVNSKTYQGNNLLISYQSHTGKRDQPTTPDTGIQHPAVSLNKCNIV